MKDLLYQPPLSEIEELLPGHSLMDAASPSGEPYDDSLTYEGF